MSNVIYIETYIFLARCIGEHTQTKARRETKRGSRMEGKIQYPDSGGG